MEYTYEALLKYNIEEAVKMLGEDKRRFTTVEEYRHANDADPARIPNNPLLKDFDWVYEHAEQLYCRNKLDYQRSQGFEQYYTLFRVLIKKYSLEDDYNKYLRGELSSASLKLKWQFFLKRLLDFMNYAFDERLEKFLNQQDVIDYLFRYPEIFDPETISVFSTEGMSNLLKYDYISSYYIEDHRRMIHLIRKHPFIKVPVKLMLNKKLIHDIARTHHIEKFYSMLYFVNEQVLEQPYLDEHRKFCDEQISNIKDGILPCYQEAYELSPKRISSFTDMRCFNSMEKQVIDRIFQRIGLKRLPSRYVYRELSKYMIIGMFISRNYQTDPYNLLIDIETLYEFAINHQKQLVSLPIYEFLVSYEEKTLEQLIDFYNKGKTIPLMEMLYDDWNSLKYEFISELNSSILSLDGLLPQTNDSGITYFDISEIEQPIIVHNTSIIIDNDKHINELIERVLKGHKHVLSLSVQDQQHKCFYEEEHTNRKKTIKFVFGPLQPDRVGIIYHRDAYSQDIDRVEFENTNYKRMLYTLEEFMERTTKFNEIVYAIDGEPFLPIGILCEDEITEVEKYVAEQLNCSILYREKKVQKKGTNQDEGFIKHYTYTDDKRLF